MNRSFIAVSVHYFDPKSLNLQTSFIACEKFEGRHTSSRVAEKLNSIFTRFGILEKVFFITTDGAGEYVAALKYNGDNYHSIQTLTDDHDVDWLYSNNTAESDVQSIANANASGSDQQDQMGVSNDNVHEQVSNLNDAGIDRRRDEDFESDSDSEELDFHRIEPSKESDDATESNRDRADVFVVHDVIDDDEPLLGAMNRVACSSHRLDKVGKVDAWNAKNDVFYQQIHENVFAKLEKVWEQKESRLNAELFSKITGRKLIGPHKIRWLKTFDAVSIKISLSFEKICVYKCEIFF